MATSFAGLLQVTNFRFGYSTAADELLHFLWFPYQLMKFKILGRTIIVLL